MQHIFHCKKDFFKRNEFIIFACNLNHCKKQPEG